MKSLIPSTLLALLLMLFSGKAEGQKEEECYYEYSFYKWKWKSCYSMDIDPIWDLNGNKVGWDTIIDELEKWTHVIFDLNYPFPETFDSARFTSSIVKNGKACKILDYSFFRWNDSEPHKYYGPWHNLINGEGGYLSDLTVTKLNSLKSGDHILVRFRFKEPNRKRIALTHFAFIVR
jgi:hypothetical protein